MAETADGGGELTRLLARVERGDRAALDRLFELVYEPLKELASKQLSLRGRGSTLATTALVHEVYLKLARAAELSANDRHHFFSLAARAMRQVLLDHARRASAARRPPADRARELSDGDLPVEVPIEDLIHVERALVRLERLDPELGRLVEWRVFAGLTLEEIAPLAGRSLASLKRDWQKARAFLHRELAGDPPATPPA